MKRENKLCIIIGCLLEKLGMNEIKITDDEFKSVKDNKKYIGVSVEHNDNYYHVKRTQKEDYTAEDIIEFVSRLLKEYK